MLSYAESAIIEDDAVAAGPRPCRRTRRDRSEPGTGALLAFLARSVNATNVVEIGTGAGVSGLWLLAGMRADGVLTHHRPLNRSTIVPRVRRSRVRRCPPDAPG